MTMLAESSAIVAELVSGGEAPEINMMIGVGVVKESEAVLFHYVGNEEPPQALMHPRTGNPLTRLSNVKLVGWLDSITLVMLSAYLLINSQTVNCLIPFFWCQIINTHISSPKIINT